VVIFLFCHSDRSERLENFREANEVEESLKYRKGISQQA